MIADHSGIERLVIDVSKGFLLYYNQHILARYLRGSMDSQDFSDEYSDISSVVSSNEISILSKDTDEEAEEIAATSLEPYQFEPIDAN